MGCSCTRCKLLHVPEITWHCTSTLLSHCKRRQDSLVARNKGLDYTLRQYVVMITTGGAASDPFCVSLVMISDKSKVFISASTCTLCAVAQKMSAHFCRSRVSVKLYKLRYVCNL